MKPLDPLDADHISLRGKLWEEDEGAVCLHDLSDLVQSTEEDAVNLWPEPLKRPSRTTLSARQARGSLISPWQYFVVSLQ